MLPRTEENAIRRQLLALLLRLDEDRVGLHAEAFGRASADGSGWDVTRRPDEEGGVRIEDEVTRGLLQNENGLVGQVLTALDRLAAGTYGTCTDCGGPISRQRLRAIPYALHCIHCARRTHPEVAP